MRPSWTWLFLALSVLSFLAPVARARDKTDVLVMRNGDRITCEIKKLDSGILVVDLDYVDGSIDVDWLKVARIESKALFIVQLQDGTVYSGNIVTMDALPGVPLKLEIRPEPDLNDVIPKGPLTVTQGEVVRITQTSANFWERFSGNITLGALYAKGNNSTQYSLSSALGYERTRWAARAQYNSNLSSTSGAPTTTRNQVDLSLARFLRNERYFYTGTAEFLQSSVQGIELQTNLGLSLGVFLKNTNRMRFAALAGLGYQKTHFVSPDSEPNITNATVGILSSRLEMFRFKKMRLDLSGSVFPALRGSDRVFSKTNATYYLKIFGKVDWNFSFYGSWDTQPPPLFQGSDYGTSTGLSWSFGNR